MYKVQLGNAKTQSRKAFRRFKRHDANASRLCVFACISFMLLAEEQHHYLGCKDAEEHTQRINRRVAY